MEPCPRLSAPPLGGAAGPEALAGPGMARAEEGPGGSVALCPSPGSQGRGCLLQLHRPHRLQPNPWRAPHLMGVTIGPGQTGGTAPHHTPHVPRPAQGAVGTGRGQRPHGGAGTHRLPPPRSPAPPTAQPLLSRAQGGACGPREKKVGAGREGRREGGARALPPPREMTRPARRGQLRLAPDR